MNILLVDDEVSFRMIASDYLQEEGFTVFMAEDGEDGLAMLEQQQIELVVSDLHMHIMDGLTFCSNARQNPAFRDIPFLFVSAYGDDETRATIGEFRNASFLTKGSPMTEMVKWIDYLTTPAELGGGYTVSVLPSTSTVADKTPAKPKTPEETRILIVDDDDSLRFLLTNILSKEGYQTTAVPDGESAIEHVKKEKFDLVLLDIMLPTISGIDVLKFIKEISLPTKVIMLTAFSQLKLAVQTKDLGADDFIGKPFMRADLLDTITRILTS